MATNRSFQLYINNDNVKQYFTTSGGALNGASIGAKYITMRSSSSTSTFTMNDAGRDALFPSSEAKANKIEVMAETIASLNNSKNTLNVAVAGRNAIATRSISNSLKEFTGSVEGIFAKASTSVVYTIKIANAFHAAGVRDTSITAYFRQYSCAANVAGNGVRSVSVSNTEPYEGEIITFSAELYSVATWHGWYSDAACTNLVSTEQIYTASAADLNLYAKATIDVVAYNCSAVDGENIVSASVSDEIVVSGESATFTAVLDHSTFDGWFSDSNYTTLVSTANPYTAVITSDTTLYAKGTKISYSIGVGTAEHGTATVSANTAHYGDSVTFTFTPEDDTWELYGWYNDAELTQLVNESNPYAHSVTGNITLYPKVGKKRYTINVTWANGYNTTYATLVRIVSVDFDKLTQSDLEKLRNGSYDSINPDAVFGLAEGTYGKYDSNCTVSLNAPITSTVSMYAYYDAGANDKKITYFTENWNPVSNGNVHIFTVDSARSFRLGRGDRCDCSAIIGDGINYAYVFPEKAVQEKSVEFKAEVASGYTFSGWYSDETCTMLVSTDNPAYITTPKYTTESASATSLTLYAKATKTITITGTGLYVKDNGTYAEVQRVYKKINGAYVEQTDIASIMNSDTKYINMN